MRAFLQVLFFYLFVKPFVLLFIGIRARGIDRIPKEGPFIMAANHSSHFDTICLMSQLPLKQLINVRPVAAADYFEANPVVAWFTNTFFNVLTIEREDFDDENHPLDVMSEAIEEGSSLIIYPEGTRGEPDEVREFKPGVAILTQRHPEVPIVPCFLVNMGEILPKGAIFPVPVFTELIVGEPYHPEGEVDERLDSLRDRILTLSDESFYGGNDG